MTYICGEDKSSEVAKHGYNEDDPYLVVPETREAVQYSSGHSLHESKLGVEPQSE